MKKILWILSLFITINAYAGDPPLSITATETPQNMGFNATQVITITVHNNVPVAPIKLNLATDRTQLTPSSPLVTWSFSDDCSYRGMAHYVPPSSDCNVNVTITSGSTAGVVQQSAVINYGPSFQTITPTPALNFSVSGGGGGGSLSFTTQPTGQNMLLNSTQDIIWTLTNTTTNDISLVPNSARFTVASSLIATPQFTNDCNDVVPGNGGTCHIQASIQSLSTAGNVSQYIAVTYNTSTVLVIDSPTNFNISGSSAGTRTFSMVNKCPYPVWFSFAGGGSSFFGCSTDADCDNKNNPSGFPKVQAGTFTCNTAVPGGQCFWKNPVVSSNSDYMLAPISGTYTVNLPEGLFMTQASQPEVWSGTISGRTGCPTSSTPPSQTQCLTGDCGGTAANVTGGCTTGISPPNIQSEPTFQNNSDFYDITTINGINVPMSMEPVNAPRDVNNPYTCGGAGVASSQTSNYGTIGGCSWALTPPSVVYNWINTAGIVCSANSDCNQAAGEACGLTKSDIQRGAGSNVPHCGTWLGYWTADEVCVLNANYAQAPFSCTSTCTGPDCAINTSYTALYGCSGGIAAATCYSNPLPSPLVNCCGCQNWQDAPTNIQVPSNPLAVTQCDGAGNPGWASIVLPKIIWQKSACPSAYSYPHDDPASSFTCSNSSTANHVNYRVTYCPGGSSGAPTGTTPNP